MKHKVKKMLLVMILTLFLILTFGSYGLYSWSLSLDGDLGYHLFYAPLASLHSKTEEFGLNLFVEKGRSGFARWRELSFADLHGEQEEELVLPEEPLPPPEPEPPLFEGETLDILVIGDSLANSVGKRLEPMMNEYKDMTCQVEGVISSNLIRLDYYDWLSEGPRLTRENAPDCVLIFLGANTMQSFYLDGTFAPLFSEKWLEIYRKRAGLLLESLQKQNVDVYWMDLPPMQKSGYNTNITYLNGVIDQVCQQKGVDRFSYTELLTDGEGCYVAEKVVEERQILIRSDGIHFTLDGASYISGYLIEELRKKYELPDPLPSLPEGDEENVLPSDLVSARGIQP
ncbi:MAG: DUF459 domain-containing protein [Spirochaetales bacterium]|nr:DUF459 domain-containing protein [Spirochaetales bacterium]